MSSDKTYIQLVFKFRQKMSDAGRLNISIGKKGKKISEEGKKNMRKSPETRLKISIKSRGMKKSDEFKEKNRINHLKEKSPFWKGGISTYERKLYLNERRRSRKRNADGSHTQGEWDLLKLQYNFKCPSCNRKEPEIKLTEDHIIPLSKGGSDNIENIQPLCNSCNCSKRDKIIYYEFERST